jgi:hypothetical protein
VIVCKIVRLIRNLIHDRWIKYAVICQVIRRRRCREVSAAQFERNRQIFNAELQAAARRYIITTKFIIFDMTDQ